MQGMKFICEIDTLNAAFEDPQELVNIIKEQVIKKLEQGNTGNRLKDSNGNFVGQWAFSLTKVDSHLTFTRE